jgi:hypothetical protein
MPDTLSASTINSNTRIPNVTRGFTLKYGQMRRAVEVECTCEWVDPKDHIRGVYDIPLSEVLKKRAHAQKLREPLEPKEVPGVIERMPKSEVWTANAKLDCLVAAREFAQLHTA